MSDYFHNADTSTDDQGWKPLPPGALVATAYRLRHRQAAVVAAARRRIVTSVVTVAAIVFGGGLAAWQVNDRQSVVVLPASHVTCEETMALLERFLSDDLPLGHAAAVRYHLDACPRCSTQYNRMLPASTCESDQAPADQASAGHSGHNH